MYRKNHWRSGVALFMAICIMSISTGSVCAAEEIQESERIRIGSDFSDVYEEDSEAETERHG